MKTNQNRIPKGASTGGQFAIDPTVPVAVAAPPAKAAAKPARRKVSAAQRVKFAAERDRKVDAAQDRLLAGIEAFSNSQEFLNALTFASKVRGYSLQNTMLLYFEHAFRRMADPSLPEDPGYFMSYNDWHKHDRQVVKGATGYPVLAPVTKPVRYYVNAQGKRVPLGKDETSPNGEPVRAGEAVVGFTVRSTFPEYLTDGEPVPHIPKPTLLEGETLPGLDDTATQLLTDAGYTVRYVNRADDPTLAGGANGYTRWDTREVVVCADLPSDRARTKTLLHELGHAFSHDPNSDAEGRLEHRGLQEVQAEATAYLVFSTLADVDTSDYSMPYIGGWLTSTAKEDKLKEAARAIKGIESVVKKVVDAYETRPGASVAA